jgi:hypothetical protein
LNFLQQHAAKGQVVTAVLFIAEPPDDLHAHLETCDAPSTRRRKGPLLGLGGTRSMPGCEAQIARVARRCLHPWLRRPDGNVGNPPASRRPCPHPAEGDMRARRAQERPHADFADCIAAFGLYTHSPAGTQDRIPADFQQEYRQWKASSQNCSRISNREK